MLRNRKRLAIGLLALLVLNCMHDSAWAQNKGKGGKGDDGSSTSGPQFAIEILNFPGGIIEFNDHGDVLGEVYDSDNDVYAFYLGTLASGVRVFDEIRVPAGWKIYLKAMNNSRHLVGVGIFDPDGDGLDADGDQILDEGDINSAGILLTPDADNDGLWEMEIVFPGPLAGACVEINNNGDIVGRDENSSVLLRVDGTLEPFPFLLQSNFGAPFSDRNANEHSYAVKLQGRNYLPERYDTATGQVISLPTFDRATFVDAYAYAVNSYGEVVGKADSFPAYWSPQGSISRIPGWSKDKNATGAAYGINELGEIVVTSQSKGPHLYRPNLGLVPLRDAIVNPEVIPAGYQLDALFYINNNSAISGRVKNASFETIPCILHPITNESP